MDIEAPRHDWHHFGRMCCVFWSRATPRLFAHARRTSNSSSTSTCDARATAPDDSAAAFWVALEADDTGRLPVPKLFFAAYGAICAVSLGGGALLGARSFRGSVAEEALDRLNPSTAQSEALAARTAGRAFAYGTALALGTGALAVLAAREILGLRSAMDVRESAHARLRPLDAWLSRHGDAFEATSKSVGAAIGSAATGLGRAVRDSTLALRLRARPSAGGEGDAE